MAKTHSPRFLKIAEDARSEIHELSVEEVQRKRERGEGVTLIDVREDHEWVIGHIPGAIHIGRGILERDIEAKFPDLGTEIVVYCGGGYRSALAAASLQRMGYTHIHSMRDGYRGWTAKGYDVSEKD